MSFNVNVIKNQFKLEGARPTLFDVEFMSVPAGIAVGNFREKMTYSCKAAQLPGSTIGVIELGYFGRKIKFAGDRTYQEWTVTFNNDEDWVVHASLEKWHEQINSTVSNLRLGDYKADVNVIQYDKKANAIKKYMFKGMWPSDVSAIDVDWDSNDTIQQPTVTFTYDWFETEDTTDRSNTA